MLAQRPLRVRVVFGRIPGLPSASPVRRMAVGIPYFASPLVRQFKQPAIVPLGHTAVWAVEETFAELQAERGLLEVSWQLSKGE